VSRNLFLVQELKNIRISCSVNFYLARQNGTPRPTSGSDIILKLDDDGMGIFLILKNNLGFSLD